MGLHSLDRQKRLVHEVPRSIEIAAEVDVLVAGAGPAGFGAALAAARTGAKTLLVEQNGVPGGTSTAGLMNTWLCPVENMTGVAREVAQRLLQRGAASANTFFNFDPEALIELQIELLSQAGVQILFHTWVVEPIMDGQRIQGVIIQSKSGRKDKGP